MDRAAAVAATYLRTRFTKQHSCARYVNDHWEVRGVSESYLDDLAAGATIFTFAHPLRLPMTFEYEIKGDTAHFIGTWEPGSDGRGFYFIPTSPSVNLLGIKLSKSRPVKVNRIGTPRR